MKNLINRFRERVNVLIAGALAMLGIGTTGCDLLGGGRVVEDNLTFPPANEEDSVDVVVCKYGVPSTDTVAVEPNPNPNDSDKVICMYGVPSATFQIKGSVSDRRTGEALEKIEVLIDTRNQQVTVVTESDGTYHYQTDWIFPTDSVFLTFTDANGVYQEKHIGEKMEYEGGNGPWDAGNARMVVDARLEKVEK